MPPTTRDRILDAFQDLLIDGGERAATLDAVSAAAGVSKGGLLYHFASKDALAAGLLDRLRELAAVDAEQIRTAASGAVDHLIRNSVDTGSPLDRAMIGAYRLAQGRHEGAKAVISAVNSGWLEAVEDAVGDPTVARLIMLVSDGLYYNSAIAEEGTDAAGSVQSRPTQAELDALLAVIARLTPTD